MVYTDSFDDFLSTERQLDEVDLPPFQFREDKSEKATHEWLIQNFDNNERAAHSRRIVYRRFQAMYKNIHWRFFDTRDTRRDMEYTHRRPRHSVNFVWEMVEGRVSQNARMKHNLAFIPNNAEQSDVNNARACKMLYDAWAEDLELEQKHQKADRVQFTFGHQFLFIEWDEDAGPLAPAFQKIKDEHPNGIPKDIKKQMPKSGEPVHIGDVTCNLYGPDRIYIEQNKFTWDEMDHITKIDYHHVDELKAMYPDKADEITENTRQIYDFDSAELIRPKFLILTSTFYHRPTKFFPEGAKIVFCDDIILEWTDFPYEDGLLPCVPSTDIDVYGEFWGRSFISNIEQMQRYYNNIQSAQARDYSWASAPKWMMPKNACNVSSLNNDITIVEYQGPIAPQLITHNPTPPQSMEMQDRLEKKISQHSTQYEISRGEVPAGVTANSALRFLDEQEGQRILIQESKRKRRVVETGKMALSRMKQYYKPDDGRMVRVLGKDNEYMIESMQNADFTRVYDVKIQNSSAMPDTKTGKISAIIDLNTATQMDPIFRKEEIVQMLDLGNDDYYKDRATVSVNAANTSLQKILDGNQIDPPDIFDDLLMFHSVFERGMQAFSYKSVDPSIKDLMTQYMKTLEKQMYNRAIKNSNFAAQVADLDNYPLFFETPMPMTKVMAGHMIDAQGVAPMGGGAGGAGADTTDIKPPTGEGAEE